MIKNIHDIKFEKKIATRDGFGLGLQKVANQNDQVVGLVADLIGSLKMEAFIAEHPERFFQIGIAEANMMGIAAGLAIGGKIPYACTFANFATSRVYDQVRQSIAYSHKNVKICASHAGLTLGEDGATHQTLEDIGLMQMLPGMVVINPCDSHQVEQATIAIADHDGPVYLRFGRPNWPVFTTELDFVIGKAQLLAQGSDITLIATGHLTWHIIEAAKALDQLGIHCDVINVHTIKPLDKDTILRSAAKTGKVIVAEEHQRLGGLGSSVAQTLAEHHPVPMRFVAVKDTFGESGNPMDLLEKYGLGVATIIEKAHSLLNHA